MQLVQTRYALHAVIGFNALSLHFETDLYKDIKNMLKIATQRQLFRQHICVSSGDVKLLASEETHLNIET